MKFIIAIIRPEMLEAVQNALSEKEVYLMTVTNVYGCGRQRGYTETFRGGQVQIRLLPKMKLEIAVNEDFVKPTIETISDIAKTGKIGDGKIFVVPLDQVVRIRTGETGNVAIGP
jgi:nitrogen regulatory protein P-II 1